MKSTFLGGTPFKILVFVGLNHPGLVNNQVNFGLEAEFLWCPR